MSTTMTGLVRGGTIELEGTAAPELEGRHVRVVIEAVDDGRKSAVEERAVWQAWVARGPQGPIDDDVDLA